jgi:hypothetical protein
MYEKKLIDLFKSKAKISKTTKCWNWQDEVKGDRYLL